MRWKLSLFSTLAMGLSVLALGCGVSAPVVESGWIHEATTAAKPPKLLQPRPKRVPENVWRYSGVVSAVGPDWVELATGWRGSVVEQPSTGRRWVRENGDSTKPKRISAAGTRPGGDPDGEGEETTHLVRDLQVGDVVFIRSYSDRAGEEWIVEIQIERRWGGKIPRMSGDPFPERDTETHLRNQAEQDWEEKGIPIPDRFLDPWGQAPWTNPPYLPPMRAPMPREVKPKMPDPAPPVMP